MLLLTLRGTPTMYYGDELGIGRVRDTAEFVQDPCGKRELALRARSFTNADAVGRHGLRRLFDA